MKAAPKLIRKPEYVPALSDIERRAYHVAHRILATDLRFPQFGAPGRRRSAIVDRIAEIILESYEKETL